MLWISKQKFFNRYLPLFLSVVVLVAAMSVYLVVKNQNKFADAAWYSASWGYRKAITIDHNKVSGTASSTINSFPVLINVTDSDLKTVSNGGKVGKDTGIDILFTSSDGSTKLSHELEKYASTTGETIAWVKIPVLSAVTDTTIFIYFGNSGASDQQDTVNVWGSNFKIVQHLGNGTTLSATDSTSNAVNGTISTPTATTGQIGGGANFNGSSDVISFANTTSFATTGASFSASFWGYISTFASNSYQHAWTIKSNGAGSRPWEMSVSNQSSYLGLLIGSSNDWAGVKSDNLPPNNTWHYYVATYNGSGAGTASNFKLYQDGILQTNGTPAGFSALTNTTQIGPTSGGGSNFWQGKLDEMRFSSTERNFDWIKTEFNNQTSPSTFYSYGTLSVQSSSPSSVTSGAGASWYNASWTYRKPITIDHNKVSGVASSTINSFPVLINVTDRDLKTVANGGKVGRTDGLDMLFTSSDGTTKLSYEMEKYASTTGETIAWVKIPILSAVTDTTIYLYFGNSGASDQSNKTGVWDSNFGGVWHFAANGNNLNMTDSTSHANNGTASGTVGSAIGTVGNGASFSGSPNFIDVGSDSSVQMTSQGTVSSWVYSTDNTDWRTVISDENVDTDRNGYSIYRINGQDNVVMELGSSSDFSYAQANEILTSNKWKHLVGTWDGSLIKIYVQGVLVSTTAQNVNAQSGVYSTKIGTAGNLNFYWVGNLDEIRVSNTARNDDWIKTEYNNQNSPSTFYAYGALQTQNKTTQSGFSSRGTSTLGWYSASWTYRKPITIDHNKVSGLASSTINSFPILFSVTDSDLKFTGSGGKMASSTGGDLLFTASDGTTKLDFEVEKYASTTGETIAWVRIPILSSVTDTTIYIYFGNNSATNQQNITGVWDSNFKGVWHLGNGYSTNSNFYKDSTTNGNNGTLTDANGNSAQAPGQIGNGFDFNGDADYINVNDANSLDITDAITFSTWINRDANAQAFPIIMCKENSAYCMHIVNTDEVRFWINGGGNNVETSNYNLNETSWYYIVGTYDKNAGSNQMKLYINSKLVATNTYSTAISTGSAPLQFGVYTSNSYWFNGMEDENRLSDTVRSPDWINTDYNNQTNPSSFYAYGALQINGRQDASGAAQPAIKSRGGVRFR